jgi:hypothetical protein
MPTPTTQLPIPERCESRHPLVTEAEVCHPLVEQAVYRPSETEKDGPSRRSMEVADRLPSSQNGRYS